MQRDEAAQYRFGEEEWDHIQPFLDTMVLSMLRFVFMRVHQNILQQSIEIHPFKKQAYSFPQHAKHNQKWQPLLFCIHVHF